MSAADTVARMLTLVPWLLERPGATVQEAADAFGVDARTVLSDLDTIGYCGLPGLGGGDLFEVDVIENRILVSMADELRRPLRLNPREALRLVLAGEAVAAAMGEELPALRSALEKVRAAAGVPSGVAVELQDDGTVWLEPLRGAIADRRRVRIAYRGRADDAPASRDVDPVTLHVYEGSWYVQGHDHRSGADRTFRLDRIAELDVLDTVFEPPDDVSYRVPRYEPGPDDVLVELALGPDVRWVADTVEADEVDDHADGTRRVVFHTDAPRWVLRLVLGAGPGVRIVRPASLADELHTEAEAALALYA